MDKKYIYLYAKDRARERNVKYSGEFCDRFDTMADLQKWCYNNLPENDMYAIAQEIFPEEDLQDLYDSELPNDLAIIEAVEYAEGAGMKRPFFVVCHGDCDYEAFQNESDVDWFDLYHTWSDTGHYEITPRYYEPGEITPEEADKLGMYMLADYIREDQGVTEEE